MSEHTLINFNEYANKTNAFNNNPSSTTPRFIRPGMQSEKLVSEEFLNEVPDKKKNASDPLKNPEDIDRVSGYFISKGKYRDNLLFIMGINFGLRCGDLVRLKVGHILNSDLSFKAEVRIEEEKSRRKANVEKGTEAKQGKIRTCYMNDAIMDAAELYFNSMSDTEVNPNDYLFKNKSNNNSIVYYEALTEIGFNPTGEVNGHIHPNSVEQILKNTINKELGIDVHAATHLLRKTFAYHVILNAPDRTYALRFLQKVLGHSSPESTLHYIGITRDEIMDVCQNLNIGGNPSAQALVKSNDICYAAGLISRVM